MLTSPLQCGVSLSTTVLTFSLGRWPLPSTAFLPGTQFQLLCDMLTKGVLSLSSRGCCSFCCTWGSCCSHRMCPPGSCSWVRRASHQTYGPFLCLSHPLPNTVRFSYQKPRLTTGHRLLSRSALPGRPLMCFLTWTLSAPWSSGPEIRHCSLHRGYRQKFSCSLKASVLWRAGQVIKKCTHRQDNMG